MKKWELLNKEDVSPSKWFPIEKHTIQLPSGDIVEDFYVTTLGDIAMVLPFTKSGGIILVKQYKHGVGEILIELPAGFKQKDKTIEASAIEELAEETGIRVEFNELKFLGKINVAPTKSNLVTYGYLVTDVEFNEAQNLEKTEEIEILIKKPKEVLEMVMRGEIWVGDSVSFILKAFFKYPHLFQ